MVQVSGIVGIKKISHMRKGDKLVNLETREVVTVAKADPLTTLTDVTYYDYDLEKDIMTTIGKDELEDYRLILEVTF